MFVKKLLDLPVDSGWSLSDKIEETKGKYREITYKLKYK